MKKSIYIMILVLILVLGGYLILNYFQDSLNLDTRGISTNKLESIKNKTYLAGYQAFKNATLDSILKSNNCTEIWVEKTWFYKRWGEIEISDSQYTFIMNLQGSINDINYSDLHQKWDIQLAGTNGFESALYGTRNFNKYILVGRLSSKTTLDSLVFIVKRRRSEENTQQIKFIRESKK